MVENNGGSNKWVLAGAVIFVLTVVFYGGIIYDRITVLHENQISVLVRLAGIDKDIAKLQNVDTESAMIRSELTRRVADLEEGERQEVYRLSPVKPGAVGGVHQ